MQNNNLYMSYSCSDIVKGRVTDEEFDKIILIMAGGYDERVVENVQHHKELQQIVGK